MVKNLWAGFYNAWVSLGWCHLLQGHLGLAWGDFQKILGLDEEAADGWGGLALVSVLRKDFSEARYCMGIATRIDPHCFPLMIAELILGNKEAPQQALKTLIRPPQKPKM